MQLLSVIEKPLSFAIKGASWLSAFVIYPLIVAIITYDIGGRFLFNSPLSWGTEGSGLCLIMAIFLVCARVDADSAHIRLDIFFSNFSARTKSLVEMVTSVFAGWWIWMLTRQSYEEIFVSMDMFESGMDVTVPFWPIRVVMTAAFALLGLQLTFNFFSSLANLINGGKNV